MNADEPANVTMKRKTSKVWKFLRSLFAHAPSFESMLRDFPRFKCRECGKLMGRMEDSPCSACVSRHANETDAMVAKLRPESWYGAHVRKRRERKAAMEAAAKQPMMGEGI